jgi:hypothetical protein
LNEPGALFKGSFLPSILQRIFVIVDSVSLRQDVMILNFLVASMAVAAWAAPTESNFNDEAYKFSPGLAEFYATVSQHIGDIGRSDANVPCDISKAALPAQASGLPSPPTGSTIKYIALGTGTQVGE